MDEVEPSRKRGLILSIILLICAICIFIGGFFIYQHIQENSARYSANEITGRIITELKLTDLTKVEQSQLSKHFDIPDGVISDSSIYMSKSSESSSELVCFLLTDQSKYKELESAVTKHISTKAAGFKSLNPSQYNALKDFLIVQNGRYVLVAVGSNTAAEEKMFKSICS